MKTPGPSLFPDSTRPATSDGHASPAPITPLQGASSRLSAEHAGTAAASPPRQGVPTGTCGADFNDRGHAYIDAQACVDLACAPPVGRQRELSGQAFRRGLQLLAAGPLRQPGA